MGYGVWGVGCGVWGVGWIAIEAGGGRGAVMYPAGGSRLTLTLTLNLNLTLNLALTLILIP